MRTKRPRSELTKGRNVQLLLSLLENDEACCVVGVSLIVFMSAEEISVLLKKKLLYRQQLPKSMRLSDKNQMRFMICSLLSVNLSHVTVFEFI